MSPGIKFFFARLFPLPFILVGAVAFFFGGRSLYRAHDSLTWSAADGQIQHSTVVFHRGGRSGGTHHAEIHYTYTINGQIHQGDTVAFGDYGSSNPTHARDLVDRYPINAVVPVRYLATDPDVCVLEPGLKLQTWFLPGFGVIFLVAGTLAVFLQRK